MSGGDGGGAVRGCGSKRGKRGCYFFYVIVLKAKICVDFFFFFFGYVLHVQNLCEWRDRQIPFFDLVFLAFLCYFLFWEERDIKFEQKYLFTSDFNRGGLRKTNETYLRWVK